MKHGGGGGFPKNRQYKGFPDSPESSGGGHEEKLDEAAAQKNAQNKDQNSPYSVMGSHKKKTPIDCGGRLAGT